MFFSNARRIEILEHRCLLAADVAVTGGQLVVNADPTGGSLHIDTVVDPSVYEVWGVNAIGEVWSTEVERNGISSLLVNGSPFHDEIRNRLALPGTINGNDGDDILVGGRVEQTIFGGRGNDRIVGRFFDDILYGGPGDDTIIAGAGADQIFGGANDDRIESEIGPDVVDGGTGRDVMIDMSNDDQVDLDTLFYQPIGLQGFNRDIVVEVGSEGPVYTTAQSFDQASATQGNNNALYEQGLLDGQGLELPNGLPSNRVIESLAVDAYFSLAAYDAPNTLQLGNNTNSRILQLHRSSLGEYGSLIVLAFGGNTFTQAQDEMTIHFEGGSSKTVSIATHDWFENTENVAFEGFGRLSLHAGVDDTADGLPRLFYTEITLDEEEQSKSISHFEFTKTDTDNRFVNILAVSGHRLDIESVEQEGPFFIDATAQAVPIIDGPISEDFLPIDFPIGTDSVAFRFVADDIDGNIASVSIAVEESPSDDDEEVIGEVLDLDDLPDQYRTSVEVEGDTRIINVSFEPRTIGDFQLRVVVEDETEITEEWVQQYRVTPQDVEPPTVVNVFATSTFDDSLDTVSVEFSEPIRDLTTLKGIQLFSHDSCQQLELGEVTPDRIQLEQETLTILLGDLEPGAGFYDLVLPSELIFDRSGNQMGADYLESFLLSLPGDNNDDGNWDISGVLYANPSGCDGATVGHIPFEETWLEQPSRFRVEFSRPVSGLTASDVLLANLSEPNQNLVGSGASLSTFDGRTWYIQGLEGLKANSGRYRMLINIEDANVVDRRGERLATNIQVDWTHRSGDIDNDGNIGFSDFLVFADNFGDFNVGFRDGDFNGDGVINFPDFLDLSSRFGQRGLLDLAVTDIQVSRNGDRLDIVGIVENVGEQDYVSDLGQQTAQLSRFSSDGQVAEIRIVPFQNVPVGESVVVLHTIDWLAQDPLPGFTLAIDFDPDNELDSNPRNDDAVTSNNQSSIAVPISFATLAPTVAAAAYRPIQQLDRGFVTDEHTADASRCVQDLVGQFADNPSKLDLANENLRARLSLPRPTRWGGRPRNGHNQGLGVLRDIEIDGQRHARTVLSWNNKRRDSPLVEGEPSESTGLLLASAPISDNSDSLTSGSLKLTEEVRFGIQRRGFISNSPAPVRQSLNRHDGRVSRERDCDNAPSEEQDACHEIAMTQDHRHPGGLQAHGDLVVVGMEQARGSTESAGVYFLRFDGLDKPELVNVHVMGNDDGTPSELLAGKEAPVRWAASAGFLKLHRGGFLLAISGRSHGKAGIFFYETDDNHIEASTEWRFVNHWTPDVLPRETCRIGIGERGLDCFIGGGGGTHLITDCNGDVYLILTTGSNATGGDEFDHLQVLELRMNPNREIELNPIWHDSRNLRRASSNNVSFRWAGGVQVTEDGRLAVLASERRTSVGGNSRVRVSVKYALD